MQARLERLADHERLAIFLEGRFQAAPFEEDVTQQAMSLEMAGMMLEHSFQDARRLDIPTLFLQNLRKLHRIRSALRMPAGKAAVDVARGIGFTDLAIQPAHFLEKLHVVGLEFGKALHHDQRPVNIAEPMMTACKKEQNRGMFRQAPQGGCQ
ncbi:MAG: hypothetical protein BWY66_00088 [bacterium ADurb.Bin374]|nr:MAG: hypothetical protein BWY66_00088 [bacterium ADurb.Bin374]